MSVSPAPAGIRCRGCGRAGLLDVFDAGRLPVHVGVLWDSAEDARRAAMGDVVLSWCAGCGLVHNRTFAPELMPFEPGYEVSLTHSALFRNFIDELAARLVERYDLRNKTILEIGCGEAYFLRKLCRLGNNNAIGIDPTVEREDLVKTDGGTIRFIRDHYSERYVHLDADFVCCQSVFETIPHPVELLTVVRRMIGDRPVPIYFEVFNGLRAFRDGETWSVHYEACNYFGSETLPRFFEMAGFEVNESGPCYGGDQYLYVEAIPGSPPGVTGAGQLLKLPPEIAGLADLRAESLHQWRRRLDGFSRDRRRVVAWGAGGKCISFLNALPTEPIVSYVVDINPARQRRYVPGSAQPVVAPAFLVDYQPDTVIITNPLYAHEIRAQVTDLGVVCDFLNV